MNNIIASFIFFTRIPLWQWVDPPRDCYRHVVEYWPLVGWVTAAVMGGTMWACSYVLPWSVSVILGIVARLLLTGALHEDGFADFCDGFGAGGDRQRTLAIMKDSHIGTYGVLGLCVYMLLVYSVFRALDPIEACLVIVAGDPYAKMLSAQIIQMLPYARTEEQSKAKTVYSKPTTLSGIILFVQGTLPMAVSAYFLYILGYLHYDYQWILFLPCLVMFFMYRMMFNRLKGYTGDCCGALFILTELSFYIAVLL